jgi:phosphate transport system substrate-binding protein
VATIVSSANRDERERMRHGVGRRSAALVGGVGLGLLLVATAVAGSVQVNPTYNLEKLKGSVTADGSSTVGPYTTAAAELFARAGASGVKVTVGISGTGGGFQRFCRGEIDLADASRPIKATEAAECIKNGVGYRRAFTVANDALTVVVNQQNTWAKCLSTDELKKIWDQGSKVSNWKDVRPGFPDVPLKLFGPGTDSGTFDYFTEAINGKSKRSRTDYQATEDDNVTVQGVSGERGAMGYFGFSYYEENKSRLNAVQIRNPKTGECVAPSAKSAQSGQYRPLARPLYIYAKASSFGRKEVQAFLDFIFDNEVKIAKRANFIPLTPAQLKKARSTFFYAVLATKKS